MEVLLAIQRDNKNFTKTWNMELVPNLNDRMSIKGVQFSVFEKRFLPEFNTIILYLSCKKELDEYYLYYLGFEEFKNVNGPTS